MRTIIGRILAWVAWHSGRMGFREFIRLANHWNNREFERMRLQLQREHEKAVAKELVDMITKVID